VPLIERAPPAPGSTSIMPPGLFVIEPLVTEKPDAWFVLLRTRSNPLFIKFPAMVGTASQQGVEGFTSMTPAAVFVNVPV
jgi:hypothetical protein